MGVAHAETAEVGLRDVEIVAQHPDPHGAAGDVDELGGPVALHERFDRHHLERQVVNAAEHDLFVLPFVLARDVADEATIVLLEDA